MHMQPTWFWIPMTMVAVLTACAAQPNRAPVVERTLPAAAGPATGAAEVVLPGVAVGADDAGRAAAAADGAKPGYHTVKPGDTLIRIGLDNGQNWRDIVRWNSIENPNVIEVGRVLRVVPPGVDAAAVASRAVPAARAEARPLDSRPALTAAAASVAPAASGAVTTPTAVAAPPAPAPARETESDLNWVWPSGGAVASGFEEGRSKGLAIVGKAGDPVLAAADGRVVYAGSGLRGYGNLVIVKHNDTYLTAYAHNQLLLVKEDQAVRRGQKIAEMGATDADRVQLHFEVRRQGKPVDPARYLPAR